MKETDDAARKQSVAERTAALPRDCIQCDGPGCGKRNPRTRCSRCHTVFYCSKQCQKGHWKIEHKGDCRKLQTLVGSINGLGKTDYLLDADGNEESIERAINDECAICLAPLKDSNAKVLSCRHGYCTKCLVSWQRHEGRSVAASSSVGGFPGMVDPRVLRCPTCRSETHDMETSIMTKVQTMAAQASSLLGQEKTKEANEVSEKALSMIIEVIDGSTDPHLQALNLQSELLHSLKRYEEALEALDRLIELDNARHHLMEHSQEMLRRFDLSQRTGIPDPEAEQELDRLENVARLEGMSGGQLSGVGKARQIGVQLARAEVLMKLERWHDALNVFRDIMTTVSEDFTNSATPPEQRQMFMGFQRCFYEVGEFEKAIEASDAAIAMNRHFPGVYKYLALSYKEIGNWDKAIETMTKAGIYETPWDDKTHEEALDLLDELIALRKSQEATSDKVNDAS